MRDLDIQTAPAASTSYDVEHVRADFPALHQEIYDGQPLVYLDNAATSQKPQAVIDRLDAYYIRENSNVHRGVHFLSQQATEEYEAAREQIARFINAPEAHQIIYTRGATEAINLVAASYGRTQVGSGDEIVISTMEHHSNIVPWQMLCEERGATLRVIPINNRGELLFDDYQRLLTERAKLVAVAHVSNSMGTVNPVQRMIDEAHRYDIPVLLDGAQAVQHMPVDVQALGCDFYCFSSHKMYGPTGIGILYGKESLLDAMPPYQGGGDMIETVTLEGTTYDRLPYKFEAGTPHIAGAIGLGAAVAYLQHLGLEAVARYEAALLHYATERLQEIDGLRLIGTAEKKASVLSFLIGDVHPYDAGTILDRLGIAVRTGHHCTQPLMKRFGIPGTVRASLALYNTREDVDALVAGLHKVKKLFS
ncbi:MAG: SufS family cysteine desulfurase [Rhodothermales bacterium]